MTDDRNDRTRTGALPWAQKVMSWTVILAVTALIALCVLIPRLTGGTPYAILTGSMKPTMSPGTLVVVKPVDAGDIGIGDVITYQIASGKPTVVTHRVVSTGTDGNGGRTFRTQGDANSAADLKPVRPVQIKGALVYEVPYLGYINRYITGKERHVAMIVVVSGLLLYAGFMFTSSARDRFRKSRHRATVGAS